MMETAAQVEKPRRDYAPPAVKSRDVRSINVFRAISGGTDFGKFRRPTR